MQKHRWIKSKEGWRCTMIALIKGNEEYQKKTSEQENYQEWRGALHNAKSVNSSFLTCNK